jgi:hypothetical protein
LARRRLKEHELALNVAGITLSLASLAQSHAQDVRIATPWILPTTAHAFGLP